MAGKIESLIFTILDPQGRAVEAYPFDVELAAPEDVPATYRCAAPSEHATTVRLALET